MFAQKGDLLVHKLSSILPAEKIETVGSLIPMPAVIRFDASNEFSVHEGKGLKLSPSSTRFMECVWGITEEDIGSLRLGKYKCKEFCQNDQILSHLGGVNCAKITLAHMNMFLRFAADKSDWYCFFISIKTVLVEVDAHYAPSLEAWDLSLGKISSSVVAKDTHIIVSPVNR